MNDRKYRGCLIGFIAALVLLGILLVLWQTKAKKVPEEGILVELQEKCQPAEEAAV